MINTIKIILEIIILTLTITKDMAIKKGFWKTAYLIIQFLVENWDLIQPPLKELIDEIKEQKNNPTS